ncbi:MAG: hypothetical protein PVJ72_10050, partial [Gammaproteobacteria bacterium]
MRSKSIFVVVVIVSLFLLLGCGGGSDGGTTPPETDLKGRFIDSAVSGMRYAATPSGMTGTTDANG